MRSHQLVSQILSKDKTVRDKAIARLYHYCSVRFLASRQSRQIDEDGLKDIIQEAIVITYQNLKDNKFNGQSSLETYAYGICKNLLRHELKNLSRHVPEPPDIADEPQDLTPLVNARKIKALLKQISLECSELLLQYYFHAKSFKELSKMYGLGSVQAVKNKKYRCLKQVNAIVKAKKLDPQFFIH